MSDSFKNQSEILAKLGIAKLNPMQEEAHQAILSQNEIILLSPTGTGKTLAFLLPVLAQLDENQSEIQALIVVPSRELAIQIEQVVRNMGSGFKANAVYGGRAGTKDRQDLKHPPAILIGTPGRVADHLSKKSFSTDYIKTLVLDEFDKSLEIGFEEEMKAICNAVPKVKKRILTSATQGVQVPGFVRLQNPSTINYLADGVAQLTLKTLISPTKEKLDTLAKAIKSFGEQRGIVFCNFKESISLVSDCLRENRIIHGAFHGGMEQLDREQALIKFRNGTYHVLVSTDLAARGIDVPELNYIIHYELPKKKEEFTHRNGRTARMNADGTAYVIQWKEEHLPDFIPDSQVYVIRNASVPEAPIWETVYVTGGRKDKISKGDIAGLFIKQGQLNTEELGAIELKQDCTYVAVHKDKVNKVIKALDNTKLKTKKVRLSVV